MGYRGHVENGKVVLDDDVSLPDGTCLDLVVVDPVSGGDAPSRGTAAAVEYPPRPVEDVLAEIAAEVPPGEWARLPSDLTGQLDHYVYGTPKR